MVNQNETTFSYLDKIPLREELRNRLEQLESEVGQAEADLEEV